MVKNSYTQPLIVNLDGTLIKTDLHIESIVLYLRTHPHHLFTPWTWLRGGKAKIKEYLARQATVNAALLPYNQNLLSHLYAEKAKGRKIILITSSHKLLADAVVLHLGMFDHVIASENNGALSDTGKRDILVDKFGEQGFDYIGSSRDDIAFLSAAQKGILVNPSSEVERCAKKSANIEHIFLSRSSNWKHWLKAFRLHQWIKNLLLFIPLLAAHQFLNLEMLMKGLLAFFCFGLCASSVYLLNDLLDIEDDRLHHTKRNRPFASGDLSLLDGILAFPLLLLAGFSLSVWLLPANFTLSMGIYYGMTLIYSLVLKRLMMIDVITLAMLYTMRIIAGSFAVGVALSFWMLAFSIFIFLSLALVKRFAELHNARNKGKTGKTRGRGYYPNDLEMISSLGAASGYLAVLVMALYIQDSSTLALYNQPVMIWPACVLLLFWVSRIWLVTHRGEMHDDPVVFAVKDPISLTVGVLFALMFWMAK